MTISVLMLFLTAAPDASSASLPTLEQTKARCQAGEHSACMGLPPSILRRGGGIEVVRGACADGDAESCFAAWLTLRERQPSQARSMLNTSCALGELRACGALARLLSSGERGVRDLTQAISLLEPYCRDSSGDAPCDDLRAQPLWNLSSIRLARVACANGELEACNELGQTFAGELDLEISGADASTAKAALDRACDGDHARSCLLLGDLLLTGRGRAKDLDGARRAFAMACDVGSGDGCERHEIIDLPLNGCNDGDAASCAELARTLSAVPSTDEDQKRAGRYWERACDLAESLCREAADATRFGEGLEPDLDAAIAFYRRGGERDLTARFDRAREGCEAEDAGACVELGDLYYGDPAGEPLQRSVAERYYQRGCAQGDAEACSRVEERFPPRGSRS
ncbi:MAG: hypothetical protein AAF605_02410 [Myxococcota bacterium]